MRNHISVDIKHFANQLRGDISGDLTSLQIILSDSTAENLSTSSYTLQQGLLKSEVSVPPLEFLRQREINKCFKSVMGSLQDYMDKLIAVINMTKEVVELQSGMTEAGIQDIIGEKYREVLMKVATDGSLRIPSKLDLLLFEPSAQDIKTAILSFYSIRNGLEHHKGISKKEQELTYRRFGTATTSGQEVTGPGPLPPGEGLILTTFEDTIKIDKGGQLAINRSQLDGMILCILAFAIPAMQDGAAKRIKGQK